MMLDLRNQGVPVTQGIQDSNPKVAKQIKQESSKTPSLLYFSKSVSARPIGYHLRVRRCKELRKQFPHWKPMLLCKLSRSSYQTWKDDWTRFLWSNVMAGANVHWSGLQLMQRLSLMHPKPEVSTWPIPQHEIVKKLVVRMERVNLTCFFLIWPDWEDFVSWWMVIRKEQDWGLDAPNPEKTKRGRLEIPS